MCFFYKQKYSKELQITLIAWVVPLDPRWTFLKYKNLFYNNVEPGKIPQFKNMLKLGFFRILYSVRGVASQFLLVSPGTILSVL